MAKNTTVQRQAEKFRQAASAAETDDDEAKFAAALKRIAKAKPKDKKPVADE
jgi:hypothetical protein